MLHKGQYGLFKVGAVLLVKVTLPVSYRLSMSQQTHHVCSAEVPVVHVNIRRHMKPPSLQCS